MQHENILKVLDIHYSQFTNDFIGFVAKKQPIYKDLILEEDLFSPEDIREEATAVPEPISKELNEVARLMNQFNCGYFRIIYT